MDTKASGVLMLCGDNPKLSPLVIRTNTRAISKSRERAKQKSRHTVKRDG
jgi:hypothetical protein